MDCCVVEVDGLEAGMLVRDTGRWVFHASGRDAARLQGKAFSSAREARAAVARHLAATARAAVS